MTQTIKLWDFHGGIHPEQNKHQSTQQAVEHAPLPKQLVLPLNQHIGAPSEAIVTAGEHVLKGQMIAKPIGPMSTALHAPTSGTITDIAEHMVAHPSGLPHTCIMLEPDGKDTWIECHNIPDYTTLSRDELIEVLRNAGIAGLGGAGFPSARKIAGSSDDMGTLIINAAECEPYITADDMLMRERAADLISGIEILAYLVKPKRIIIGIEDNKPQAIAALKTVLDHAPERVLKIELIPIPTKYPSGGEKQLIKILTGIEVPSGTVPASVGIICHNVGTAAAIHQAVNLGRPLISRITTVTGENIPSPRNYEVLLGTPVKDLLEYCAYQGQSNDRVIMGGPMMGFQLPSTHVPVIKTTNCILAPSTTELPSPADAQPCIRCGACSEACPASLLPQQLYWFSKSKEFEKAEHHNLFDCIECGACSYVCPSSIPLVQYYRYAKGEIRNEREEKRKSEQAKQRFEARQQRLAQEQAEKEARRKARTQAAKAKKPAAAEKDNADKKTIEDALARVQNKKQSKTSDTATATTGTALSTEQITAKIEQTEKRLERAKQRVTAAEESGMDTVEALKAGVVKLEDKLKELQATLSTANSKPSSNNDSSTTEPSNTAPSKNDRYANMTVAQLEKQISLSEQRIQSTQQRVAEAMEQGLDTIDALQSGLNKQQAKLSELQTALDGKKAQA